LDLPVHNYNETLKVLQEEEHMKMDRNRWKSDVWQKQEKVGRGIWEWASHKYFRQEMSMSMSMPLSLFCALNPDAHLEPALPTSDACFSMSQKLATLAYMSPALY
jgi:hypothetical protein